MAVLSVVNTAPGVPATTTLVAAAGGGDSFPNTGVEQFRVRNADASSKTVTFVAQNAVGCPAGVLHNIVLTVPAGAEQTVRNLDMARFNDANGRVQVTYSAVTSVTVGVEV